VSAGQFAADPVQFSATSQAPADARHVVALETNPFDGHALAAPVQASATSHVPAAARHTVPAGW